MTRYITKQRNRLLEYLNDHPDQLLSAKQISDGLKEDKISVSAVYRNLAELETEGRVRRSAQNGSREVFFQFIDNAQCRGHMHLHCLKCGRTYHLNDEISNQLKTSLMELDGFSLIVDKTVLSGICQTCRDSEEVH